MWRRVMDESMETDPVYQQDTEEGSGEEEMPAQPQANTQVLTSLPLAVYATNTLPLAQVELYRYPASVIALELAQKPELLKSHTTYHIVFYRKFLFMTEKCK